MTLHVEYHQAATMAVAVSQLARHMHTRQELGKIVIVTTRPIILLAALRKEWLALGRAVQRERASTINLPLVRELTQRWQTMQQLRFTKEHDTSADVFFIQPHELGPLPPGCQTLYLYEIPAGQCQQWIGKLAAGVAVVYGE